MLSANLQKKDIGRNLIELNKLFRSVSRRIGLHRLMQVDFISIDVF